MSLPGGGKTDQITANTKNKELKLKDKIKRIFREQFLKEPLMVFAPGRINLIGDHTDYNSGFVLPAAINRGVFMALAENGTDSCKLVSLDMGEAVEVNLKNSLMPVNTGWANYIIGVMDGLRNQGLEFNGFDAVFGGNIPIGSGLSSSAALECAAVLGISKLSGTEISENDMISIAQKAEHEFAGVKCGIMDQFASIMGKEDNAMRLDCRSLQYEYLPLDLKDCGFVLLDTKVSHSLGDSQYNKRREECCEGLNTIRKKHPEASSFRELTMEMLEECKNELTEKVYNRCSFVLEENSRVIRAGTYLRSGLGKEFGQLMYASHEGLSNLYEVSCAELDLLVEAARGLKPVYGARMMGGGFGGCTLNLIANKGKEKSISQLRQSFETAFGRKPGVYEVNVIDGARII